jgi:hypothetical protein
VCGARETRLWAVPGHGDRAPVGALGRRRMPGASQRGVVAGRLDHCVSGWRSRVFLHSGRVPSLPGRR